MSTDTPTPAPHDDDHDDAVPKPGTEKEWRLKVWDHVVTKLMYPALGLLLAMGYSWLNHNNSVKGYDKLAGKLNSELLDTLDEMRDRINLQTEEIWRVQRDIRDLERKAPEEHLGPTMPAPLAPLRPTVRSDHLMTPSKAPAGGGRLPMPGLRPVPPPPPAPTSQPAVSQMLQRLAPLKRAKMQVPARLGDVK
jgi:hypothetical protein